MAGNAPVWSKNDYGGRQLTSYNSQVRQGQQTGLHQKTTKASIVDKQTGNYSRAINKEVMSSGETFKERSTGRLGYKDEYKTTSTYRVGDRGGYGEYQVEERYRSINFDDSRNSKNNNSGKDYSISNKNYGGSRYGNYNDGCYNNKGHSGFRDYMPSIKGSDHNQYDDEDDSEDGDEEDHGAISDEEEYEESGGSDEEEYEESGGSDEEEYEDDFSNSDGGDFDDSDYYSDCSD